jgi:hypothetical protein
MYNESSSRVHGKHSHDKLTSQIAEFPILDTNKTLYSPSLSPYDQARMDLMLQTLNKESFKKDFCYKSCFKLSNLRYTEFCLQKKCNATLNEAAGALNLLK